MYYKGKLYGKSRGRYFELEETSEDVDKLKERIKELEALVPKNDSLHLVSESLICDKCKKEVEEKHDVGDLKGNKIGVMCNDCILKLLEDNKLIHVNYSR
jgi:hypothetical protein